MTQSIAITDSMFNFGNFLTKNTITFDHKEIERKKSRRHENLLHIKKCQNCKNKKQTFFPKYFLQNRQYLKKIQIFRKHKVYFQNLEVFPVILTIYLPV